MDFGMLIEIGALLVAVVWTVSKIKSTTERLGDRIGTLGKSVDDLRTDLKFIHNEQQEQKIRLAVLEDRTARDADKKASA